MEISARVLRRFLAFKYDQKEKKETKVKRLAETIREKTGLGRGQAEDIADAIVRGREVERLAIQKSWPIENGTLTGPKGEISLSDLRP